MRTIFLLITIIFLFTGCAPIGRQDPLLSLESQEAQSGTSLSESEAFGSHKEPLITETGFPLPVVSDSSFVESSVEVDVKEFWPKGLPGEIKNLTLHYADDSLLLFSIITETEFSSNEPGTALPTDSMYLYHYLDEKMISSTDFSDSYMMVWDAAYNDGTIYFVSSDPNGYSTQFLLSSISIDTGEEKALKRIQSEYNPGAYPNLETINGHCYLIYNNDDAQAMCIDEIEGDNLVNIFSKGYDDRCLAYATRVSSGGNHLVYADKATANGQDTIYMNLFHGDSITRFEMEDMQQAAFAADENGIWYSYGLSDGMVSRIRKDGTREKFMLEDSILRPMNNAFQGAITVSDNGEMFYLYEEDGICYKASVDGYDNHSDSSLYFLGAGKNRCFVFNWKKTELCLLTACTAE